MALAAGLDEVLKKLESSEVWSGSSGGVRVVGE